MERRHAGEADRAEGQPDPQRQHAARARWPSEPANGPARIIAALNGSSVKPASVGLAPNPNAGDCTRPGTSTKNAVIEKPTRTVEAFVAAMPGRSSVGRSTSGFSTRRSIWTQPVSAAIARPVRREHAR